MLRWLSILWALVVSYLPLTAADKPDFDRAVAPILMKHCFDCHSGAEPKGGLDLATAKATKAGGDTGPGIVPGKLAESHVWLRVAQKQMPPKKPLGEAEQAILKAWIESGATWGTDPIDPTALTNEHRAGRDWWSLKPIVRPEPPKVAAGNPIDQFIVAKLQAKQLAMSPRAEPRVLIRRLYFDLVGLPPPLDVVDQFVKDPSPKHYGEIVERLLASTQFGERWARHWLDVVRYSESDGFERNNPRANAWHYRDWVIDAINRDLPYDQFVKLQIAGDILKPNDADATKATGFLVAGIHNTVLGSNATANKTAREDELEDIIATVGGSFLGLTVQCARCHDHKFDPITQGDYYRLNAALGGVHHGERTIAPSTSPEQQAKLAALRQRLATIERELTTLATEARTKAMKARPGGEERLALPVAPRARWAFDKDGKDDLGQYPLTLKNTAKIERGRLILDGQTAFALSPPLKDDLHEKTLEVWLTLPTLEQGGGGALTIETNDGTIFDAIVFAEQNPKRWMAGSNSFRRTANVNGTDEIVKPNELVHVVIVYRSNNEIELFRDGKPYGKAYRPQGADSQLQTYKKGQARFALGIRHTGGGRAYLKAEIEEARVYGTALTAEQIATSHKIGPGGQFVTDAEMQAAFTQGQREQYATLSREKAEQTRELDRMTQTLKVYAVAGKAVPTTHILSRGSVEKPTKEVTAGGVAALPGRSDFGLTNKASEGERRAQLANWLARADNPLFARVAVNRRWQHHFGIGIVDTPSDFGFNGGRPSHPELLDWLAAELIAQKYSLKAIHRLIVTSQAYQQQSTKRADAFKLDADNRLLWRKTPQRIDAETLRDTILSFAGQLDLTPGGPGYQDVKTYFNAGTTYYEPLEVLPKEAKRRTIYRFAPRGERSALLENFDCPDPSAQTPRRQVTTTPLQALTLWNNRFVLDAAKALGDRIEQSAAKTSAERVTLAYRLVLSRTPSKEELTLAIDLVEKHGLPALGRVLFNCNELVVIE